MEGSIEWPDLPARLKLDSQDVFHKSVTDADSRRKLSPDIRCMGCMRCPQVQVSPRFFLQLNCSITCHQQEDSILVACIKVEADKVVPYL